MRHLLPASRPRPRLALDTVDLLGAALVAPLVVPFVIAAWVGAAGVGMAGTSAPVRLLDGFFMGIVIGLPYAYPMTVFVALPVVLSLRYFFGRVTLPILLPLGAVLGSGLGAFVHMPIEVVSLFASCGAATATAFWWFGSRNDVRLPDAD